MKMVADVRILRDHIDYLIGKVFRVWTREAYAHVLVDLGDLLQQHIKGHAAFLLPLVDRLRVLTVTNSRVLEMFH